LVEVFVPEDRTTALRLRPEEPGEIEPLVQVYGQSVEHHPGGGREAMAAVTEDVDLLHLPILHPADGRRKRRPPPA